MYAENALQVLWPYVSTMQILLSRTLMKERKPYKLNEGVCCSSVQTMLRYVQWSYLWTNTFWFQQSVSSWCLHSLQWWFNSINMYWFVCRWTVLWRMGSWKVCKWIWISLVGLPSSLQSVTLSWFFSIYPNPIADCRWRAFVTVWWDRGTTWTMAGWLLARQWESFAAGRSVCFLLRSTLCLA